jgi:hypothetical protein
LAVAFLFAGGFFLEAGGDAVAGEVSWVPVVRSLSRSRGLLVAQTFFVETWV